MNSQQQEQSHADNPRQRISRAQPNNDRKRSSKQSTTIRRLASEEEEEPEFTRRTMRSAKLRKQRSKRLKIKVVNTVVMCYLSEEGYQMVPHVRIINHRIRHDEKPDITQEARQSGLHLAREMLEKLSTSPPVLQYKLAVMQQSSFGVPGMTLQEFVQLPQLN